MTSPETLVSASTFSLLLILMALKNFVADFVLQTDWMVRGKGRVEGWGPPLAAHAGVHALGTLALALLVEPALWWLMLVDFVVHGLIDRGKTLADQRMRWPMTDPKFWWLVGFDQFLHQVTNVLLVLILVLA